MEKEKLPNLEPEEKNSIIEDKELELSYSDKIVSLPEYRRKQIGIDHIIKREIIKSYYSSELATRLPNRKI